MGMGVEGMRGWTQDDIIHKDSKVWLVSRHNIVITSSFWLDIDDFRPKLVPFVFPFSFDPFFLLL